MAEPELASDSEPAESSGAVAQLRRFVRMRGGWLVGLVAVLDLIVIAVGAGSELNKTVVPDLRGQDLASALALVESSDLVVDWKPDVSVGPARTDSFVVEEQRIRPGERVPRDSIIGITIAALVPDLIGVSVPEALALLDELHLRPEWEDPEVPVQVLAFYEVSGQDLEAASALGIGRELGFEITPTTVSVPEVVGSTFDGAEQALADHGLTISASNEMALPVGLSAAEADIDALFQHHDDWVIVAQSMEAGTRRDAGSAVTVTLEVPAVAVPDLTGLTRDAAKSALQSAGLMFDATTGSGGGNWTVASQSVPAAALVLPGTSVGFTLGAPQIVFAVTGNGSRATVTWIPPGSFSIAQDVNAAVPWSRSFDDLGYSSYERGNFSAQSMNGNSITCTIAVNGVVVQTNTSTGQYAVVSCG